MLQVREEEIRRKEEEKRKESERIKREQLERDKLRKTKDLEEQQKRMEAAKYQIDEAVRNIIVSKYLFSLKLFRDLLDYARCLALP